MVILLVIWQHGLWRPTHCDAMCIAYATRRTLVLLLCSVLASLSLSLCKGADYLFKILFLSIITYLFAQNILFMAKTNSQCAGRSICCLYILRIVYIFNNFVLVCQKVQQARPNRWWHRCLCLHAVRCPASRSVRSASACERVEGTDTRCVL